MMNEGPFKRIYSSLSFFIRTPATHLATIYADRGEFDRQHFRHRLMRTHLAIFSPDRGDVAVLKTHVIKSPNLMGWLYWRFIAIIVENRGNGHTWRMPANLIADTDLTCQISAILYADRGDRRKS